ncbi:MAG: EAL domain-containing protein [Pseudomonadota bacterium]
MALVVTVAAILASLTVSLNYTRQGGLDEELLNVSGRQRMLSQRIVLAAVRYDETQDPRYRGILVESLGDFTESHNWLLSQLQPDTPVWEHYRGEDGAQLDARTTEFISIVSQIADAQTRGPAPPALMQDAEDRAFFDLLGALNGAVMLFEDAANSRSEHQKYFQKGAMLVVLLVVGLQAVFVFVPAHRQLSGMIRRLQSLAEIDPLTRLSNRRHFIAQTQMLLDQHQHELERVFILALDLDGFKQVNDTLGHPVGDAVLRSVADDLRRIFAASPDLSTFELARQGGDEFLAFGVLDPGATATVAEWLADHLIDDLSKPIPVALRDANSTDVRVGVSVGIAFGTELCRNIDVLIANADIALYASKKSGKGIATGFRASMREEAEARNQWANEITRGLQELEFEAFFQPQIDLATGRVVGLEALARWHHPKLGLIEPAHFMDQIEQASKSDLLDGQIILRTVEALRHLRKQGLFIERMAVNVSGTLLRDPTFSTTFSEIVKEHFLPPEDFTVEVLESVVLDTGRDEAIATVQRLMRQGFQVAIDDFGTGYSSLESVAAIGGSILKIDKSLVRQLGDPRIHKILTAAIAMGHGLGVSVYAEGAETATHLERLQQLGVEVVQGYQIGAPMALPELQAWLASLPKAKAERGRPPAPQWLPSRKRRQPPMRFDRAAAPDR